MKARLLCLVCFMCYCFISMAQQAPLSSDSLLKASIAKASKENKNVFVIFKASWCSWCYKMDSSINDKSCKKFFDDNYIICHLVVLESKNKKNLENPGAAEMFTKFGGPDQGLPFWLIFDKNGTLLSDSQIRKEGDGLDKPGQNTGCPTQPEEVNYFLSVLKKTSHITQAELKIIEKRFLENAR